MRGWKPVERSIEQGIGLDRIVSCVESHGFSAIQVEAGRAALTRKGSQLTVDGGRMPLKLEVLEVERGHVFRLRYGVFVLFDTGDLGRIADELVAAIVVSG